MTNTKPSVEEIISQYKPMGEYPCYYHESDIEPMMQEYAKQKAIEFAKWIASQEGIYKISLNDNDWYYEGDREGDQPLTEEQLFDKYTTYITTLTE